jgi:hypothetical protein
MSRDKLDYFSSLKNARMLESKKSGDFSFAPSTAMRRYRRRDQVPAEA